MSMYYSNAVLQSITKALIDELRDCEDGTVITTYRLLKEAGYGSYDLILMT